MNTLDTSNPNNYQYTTQHFEIHILGGLKTNKLDSLRVTLSLQKPNQHNVLRHSLDLYNDNQVEKFTRTIAERLEIGTSVTRQTLQVLTKELENRRFLLLEKEAANAAPFYKELSASELRAAESFLKKMNLLENTNELIGKSGVIGEAVNRLLMYLIFTSRKTNNPLHCISLGSSGVGKTHLQSKVAELIPEEDKIEITVLSANAFYYFNRTELQHKLILIEDLDGAESVLYPLRELQSKKRITKTVVHKDAKGTTKTIHLTVEGPVCVAGCTTQESIYEDNSNRSFLLYIDESPEQDKRIMNYQRLISAGKLNGQEQHASRDLLQNVQRVLKPIKVINPFAEYLELPQSVFKPRRTNSHYLQFIEAITFYCQRQRQKKYDENTGEEYIETTIEDIRQANELIAEVLLRKSDTITGATRNHLECLKAYLKENNRNTFTNSEIRRKLRVKETTLRRYNKQLLEENYIRRIKKTKSKSYCFEVVDVDEYTNLRQQIDDALNACLHRLDAATSPPSRHPQNGEVKKQKVSEL
jgi:predicted transcriptional regulator